MNERDTPLYINHNGNRDSSILTSFHTGYLDQERRMGNLRHEGAKYGHKKKIRYMIKSSIGQVRYRNEADNSRGKLHVLRKRATVQHCLCWAT